MSRKLSEWRDNFKNSRVQDSKLKAGDFLSGETSVFVSGPPKLDLSGVNNLIPIGLVQNFAVNQGKQIFTYNEVGSSVPYMIPGRTRISASMSRVLFDGPSLMYVLNLSYNSGVYDEFQDVPEGVGGVNNDALMDKPTSPFPVPDKNGVISITHGKGATQLGDFMVNLRSSFFNKPLGLGVVLYDNESQPYGGFYLEENYINAYNLAIQSQAVVLMENVSMFATNIVPLNKDLIAGSIA